MLLLTAKLVEDQFVVAIFLRAGCGDFLLTFSRKGSRFFERFFPFFYPFYLFFGAVGQRGVVFQESYFSIAFKPFLPGCSWLCFLFFLLFEEVGGVVSDQFSITDSALVFIEAFVSAGEKTRLLLVIIGSFHG